MVVNKWDLVEEKTNQSTKEFSDKITTVSRLTSEGVKDLFVKL